jgi:hypothetical protein
MEEKTLVVPDGCKEAYSEKKIWEQFGRILEKHEYELGIDRTVSDLSESIKENVFDLQGRRLQSAPSKGLYIRGGKKYLVR